MRHLILPNDFHEFSSRSSNSSTKFSSPFMKKGMTESAPLASLNKSSSLGSLALLDQVDEDCDEDEKKKKRLFHHIDIIKDCLEEKNYVKKSSYVESSESPIRESNIEEENKEEGRKKLTPRGKAMFNLKCDEVGEKRREEKSEKMEEVIVEEKDDGFLEMSGKKGNFLGFYGEFREKCSFSL